MQVMPAKAKDEKKIELEGIREDYGIKHPFENSMPSRYTYRKWMYLGRNISHECLLSQSVSVLSSFKRSCLQ